ncbi:hypothetical protein [Enterococcus gallinarum]|uniref:hypothetical protein n=1 Tax=Enterococcus gallinarum TaxID=1353 RepID=UPI00321BD8E5
MIVALAGVLTVVLAAFFFFRPSGFTGYYEGEDDFGNNYSLSVKDDEVTLLNDGEISTHKGEYNDIDNSNKKYLLVDDKHIKLDMGKIWMDQIHIRCFYQTRIVVILVK